MEGFHQRQATTSSGSGSSDTSRSAATSRIYSNGIFPVGPATNSSGSSSSSVGQIVHQHPQPSASLPQLLTANSMAPCVPRRLSCCQCGLECANLEQLHAHIAVEHVHYLAYECAKCEAARFPTDFALRKHYIELHGTNRFKVIYHVSPEDDDRCAQLVAMTRMSSQGRRIGSTDQPIQGVMFPGQVFANSTPPVQIMPTPQPQPSTSNHHRSLVYEIPDEMDDEEVQIVATSAVIDTPGGSRLARPASPPASTPSGPCPLQNLRQMLEQQPRRHVEPVQGAQQRQASLYDAERRRIAHTANNSSPVAQAPPSQSAPRNTTSQVSGFPAADLLIRGTGPPGISPPTPTGRRKRRREGANEPRVPGTTVITAPGHAIARPMNPTNSNGVPPQQQSRMTAAYLQQNVQQRATPAVHPERSAAVSVGSSSTVLTRSIVPPPNYYAQSQNQSALISAMVNPLHFSTGEMRNHVTQSSNNLAVGTTDPNVVLPSPLSIDTGTPPHLLPDFVDPNTAGPSASGRRPVVENLESVLDSLRQLPVGGDSSSTSNASKNSRRKQNLSFFAPSESGSDDLSISTQKLYTVWQCALCVKQFLTRRFVWRHIRTVHRPPELALMPFSCAQCPDFPVNVGEKAYEKIRMHIKNDHNGDRSLIKDNRRQIQLIHQRLHGAVLVPEDQFRALSEQYKKSGKSPVPRVVETIQNINAPSDVPIGMEVIRYGNCVRVVRDTIGVGQNVNPNGNNASTSAGTSPPVITMDDRIAQPQCSPSKSTANLPIAIVRPIEQSTAISVADLMESEYRTTSIVPTLGPKNETAAVNEESIEAPTATVIIKENQAVAFSQDNEIIIDNAEVAASAISLNLDNGNQSSLNSSISDNDLESRSNSARSNSRRSCADQALARIIVSQAVLADSVVRMGTVTDSEEHDTFVTRYLQRERKGMQPNSSSSRFGQSPMSPGTPINRKKSPVKSGPSTITFRTQTPRIECRHCKMAVIGSHGVLKFHVLQHHNKIPMAICRRCRPKVEFKDMAEARRHCDETHDGDYRGLICNRMAVEENVRKLLAEYFPPDESLEKQPPNGLPVETVGSPMSFAGDELKRYMAQLAAACPLVVLRRLPDECFTSKSARRKFAQSAIQKRTSERQLKMTADPIGSNLFVNLEQASSSSGAGEEEKYSEMTLFAKLS